MSTQNVKHVFEVFPVLETPRLILREVVSSDAPALVGLATYDGFTATNETEVRAILHKINLNYTQGDSILWGICLRDPDMTNHNTSPVIGLCSYHRGYANNVGEIGYVLAPEQRGQGIMTEAVTCISEFGLSTMQLDAVVAYVDVINPASANVLQRAGFHLHERNTQNETLTFMKYAST
ncbi:MAG: GNAT family N-acetyltransferase [Deinococcota bacterium]